MGTSPPSPLPEGQQRPPGLRGVLEDRPADQTRCSSEDPSSFILRFSGGPSGPECERTRWALCGQSEGPDAQEPPAPWPGLPQPTDRLPRRCAQRAPCPVVASESTDPFLDTHFLHLPHPFHPEKEAFSTENWKREGDGRCAPRCRPGLAIPRVDTVNMSASKHTLCHRNQM